ncbi:hypothetical protein NKH52_18670 [Mesorhizobium sp. M1066]|uniref:hypothetical protein n=1 Tax=unclassified Mesorhizobium TaxID=325217 RepID=UPI0033370472
MTKLPPEQIRDFFARSPFVPGMVLRRLSHIKHNWEVGWDPHSGRYLPEPFSLAADLNEVIDQIAATTPPGRYHDHEDIIVGCVSSIFSAEKQGGRWRGDDYGFLLEQGLMMSGRLDDLILAATGRVYAAINSGQKHFDDVEHGHLRMLSDILATIVFYYYGCRCALEEDPEES